MSGTTLRLQSSMLQVLLPLLLVAMAPQGVAADADDADELPSGQVYRHVDAAGNVLFTDQRPEGAEPVNVPSGNQFEGREAAERARRAASSSRGAGREEDARRLQVPVDTPASVTNRQQRESQEQLRQRVAACERSNVADCSPATVRRRLEEERYRMTPEGRSQQEAIGNRNRANRGW
ncbi:MAG: DUF4124 domain-containing protein [Alcanivorax sp.]|nr:DUF4124 domain-containing protein [Alcanivorax sp.]